MGQFNCFLSALLCASVCSSANLVAAPPIVLKPNNGRITGLAFSADSGHLAVAAAETVTVTNVKTRKQESILEHPGSVYSTAFSPDGKVLAAGYTLRVDSPCGEMPAGAVRLWNVEARSEVVTFKGDVLSNPV